MINTYLPYAAFVAILLRITIFGNNWGEADALWPICALLAWRWSIDARPKPPVVIPLNDEIRAELTRLKAITNTELTDLKATINGMKAVKILGGR